MSDITFQVERDEATGWHTASWEDSSNAGGITTQGKNLQELQDNVREAVRCHFDGQARPQQIRLKSH